MAVYNWRRNARLYTELTSGDTYVGVYVRRDGNLARVNVAEAAISVPVTGQYRPWPGDPVILKWEQGRLLMTGPAIPKASTGTVTATGNPYLTVKVDGRSYRLPYIVSYTPTVKDLVGIQWDAENSYVTGKITAPASPDSIDETITVDQKPFDLTFFAKQSGSFKSGSRYTDNLVAAPGETAAWWYGSTIRNTLKDEAFIASVQLYLPHPIRRSGARPTLARHTEAGPNTSGPSFQDLFTAPAWFGWITLPVAWAETWRTDPGGVGIDRGGNSVYPGRSRDKQSGKLRIRGRQ